MVEKDSIRFAEIMSALAELYEMNLSETMMEIWFKSLAEFPIDSVAQAAFKYMKNPDIGRFKPKPADIVRMISGSTSDSACLAWTKVDKTIRTIGDYQTVVFDDPIIHQVITDMGGWIGFGDVKEDEWPFRAKEFQQRYRIHLNREVGVEAPKQLSGQHALRQLREGYDPPEPMLLGDKEKSRFILDNYGKAKPQLEDGLKSFLVPDMGKYQ